jgi:hypothetical protein
MKKILLSFIGLIIVGQFCGCGKSAKEIAQERQDSLIRAKFVQDSLRKDSVIRDSIRWTLSTPDLTFHGLVGPIQECKYKVSDGSIYVVRFDKKGHVTSNIIVGPNSIQMMSFKKGGNGCFSGPIKSDWGNGAIVCDKAGRLKTFGTCHFKYDKGKIYPNSGENMEEQYAHYFEYKSFDDHGNWTKCVDTFYHGMGFGAYSTTITRIITAYPFK